MDGDCSGSPSSCYNQFYSSTCYGIDGCYWSSYSKSCSGSARSCGGYSGGASCRSQTGCRWSEDCAGEATSCALLDLISCDQQLGCSATCAADLSRCGTQCVDLLDDEQNCGACGLSCGFRGSCTAGACECAAPAVSCNGTCVDLRDDSENCGACGKRCGAGFSCHAGQCTDDDECAEGRCTDGRSCENRAGSYQCGACPAGFGPDGDGCRDIDECITQNGGCDANALCVNDLGSHHCGACKGGFTGDSKSGCRDVDECLKNNGGCDPLSRCTNTQGSFVCGACPVGYVGTGATGCADVDECQNDNGGCDYRTSCTNIAGGRTCGACPKGFQGTGEAGCVDIDECANDNGGCDLNTLCSNVAGSFSCGACPTGYQGTGATGCSDIDECVNNNGGCDPLVTCQNRPGTRLCPACPEGYSGDPQVECRPFLLDLATNAGSWAPAFDPNTFNYTLTLGLTTPSVSFTPQAPVGATVSIGGVSVSTGTPSEAIALPVGTSRTVTVVVGRQGRSSRSYQITIQRALAMRSPFEIPARGCALDGQTLIVIEPSYPGGLQTYSLAGATPQLLSKVAPPTGFSYFEENVAVDGIHLAARAKDVALMYTRSGDTWIHTQTLTPPADGTSFGGSIALDGDLLSVWAYPKPLLYRYRGNTWQIEKVFDTGFMLALEGGRVYLGNYDTHSVSVFADQGNGFEVVQTISHDVLPDELFPNSLATDGDTMLIGGGKSYGYQYVRLYEREGDGFVFRRQLALSGGQSSERAYAGPLAVRGDVAVVSHERDETTGFGVNPTSTTLQKHVYTGAVHLFSRTESWNQSAWLKRPNSSAGQMFGLSTLLSATHLVVGTNSLDGKAIIYRYAD